MNDERVERDETGEVADTDTDDTGNKKPKPCPFGVHGQHFFIGGRCVRCGEPEPAER